ncbi:MAG: DUF349 domain-containing protein [Gammaproteobacteria bacterium]|nr:DUF349 domain-containing protein [Gammaproteobacteria bacterium]
MFINRLLAPKWKHKNPRVRKQALLSLNAGLDESQKIFVDVINNDVEINLRRFAISRLNNIDCVLVLRKGDLENLLIEDLTKRLCELLAGACGSSDHSLDSNYYMEKLDEIGEMCFVDYVAHHGKSVELRKLALAKIKNESVLAEIAVTDDDDAIRSAALDCVTSPAALERVVKNARRKDKNIYLIAQQKLAAWQRQKVEFIERQKKTQRISADIVELVRLCTHSQQWLKNESRLLDLFQSWDESRKHQQNDAELSAKVEQANVQFQQGLIEQKKREEIEVREEQAFAPVFNKMQEICESMRHKIEELRQQAEPSEENIADVILFAKHMDTEWQQLKQQYHNKGNPGCSAKAAFLEYSAEYEGLVGDFSLCVKDANTLGEYIAELNKLTMLAGELLKKTEPIAVNELGGLQQQYQAIKTPCKMTLPGGLQRRFEGLLKELSSVQQQQISLQKTRIEEITTLTAQLEDAIEQGKTKYALNLANRGKKLFKALSAMDSRTLQKQGVISSFQKSIHRMNELTDWRQWSSQPVKRQLCEVMEQLAMDIKAQQENEGYDYSAAVQQIKQARQEWRGISSGAPDTDKLLWERFDQVCNNAYAFCQQYFDRQAMDRQLNYEKREKVCQDLEQYYQKISQQSRENIDWRALGKILQAARQEWQQLGVVNRSEKDKINGRFKHILTQIEAISRDQKQHNSDEKQIVIKRAKTVQVLLSDGKISVQEAVESIKELQGKWKKIGAARKDKQLWEAFREICNHVFSLRQAELDIIRQTRQEDDIKRETICKELECLAQLKGDALKQARSVMLSLKNDWHALAGLKKQHPQERRFQRACDAYEEQEKMRVSEALINAQQMINQNAKACWQLEKTFFECLEGRCEMGALTALVDKTQQQWGSSHVRSLVDKAISTRLDTVIGWVEKLQHQDKASIINAIKLQEIDVIQKKELLCLEVEILANVDSPPEMQQARMEYQVSQLANKMRQKEDVKLDEALERLLVSWHQAGILSTAANDVIENRFYAAVRVIDKNY